MYICTKRPSRVRSAACLRMYAYIQASCFTHVCVHGLMHVCTCIHTYINTYILQVRERKRTFDEFTHEGHDDHEGLDEASLKEHEEVTKIKNVNKIQVTKQKSVFRSLFYD